MGAIPVHHTATTDEPWDGPAAVAAMPAKADVLKYCHAWFDSADGRDGDDGSDGDKDSDGNEKRWYKFPHHKAKGGPANLAACRNGLARLAGAHIPDGDRDGVRAHLQAHLDDADKKDSMFIPIDDRLRTALPEVKAKADGWYSIKNAAGDEPEVYLYDEVGGWFGSTADEFVAELNAITAPKIKLRVNSPGGSVFDGVAIANALRAHPANVTVQVDGIAASIASVIAMAGDRIVMMPNSTLMIHDASGVCMGNAADMAQMGTLLDTLSDNIADAYAAKAGGTREDWRTSMRAESWYMPEDAVAAGLADEAVPARPDQDAPDSDPAEPPATPVTPVPGPPAQQPAANADGLTINIGTALGEALAEAVRTAVAPQTPATEPVPDPPTEPVPAPADAANEWAAIAARITAPPSADDTFTRLKEALK